MPPGVAALYLTALDLAGLISQPPNVISAETDEDAIEFARQLVDGHDVELWQDDRRVTTLHRSQPAG